MSTPDLLARLAESLDRPRRAATQTPPAADRHAPSRTHRAPVEGDPGRSAPCSTSSPGLPTPCSDTGCPSPATYEASWLFRDRSTGRMWHGSWRPQCTECALDDAGTIRPDQGLHGSRVIATTIRPLRSEP